MFRVLRLAAVYMAILQQCSGSAVNWMRQTTGWPQSVATEVHNASWPDFTEATERWSTFSAPTFNAVFIPKSKEDLAAGVSYLAGNGIPFLARSGGHGYSTTLKLIQNGTLINMENFNYTRMNTDGTATVGAGASFNDLVQVLGGAGREVTVGSCPCVGATGAMLGGGVGRLQGLHGLTTDAVRKISMVLWNGTIVEASDSVNPDLFWGMRGAGQNFGVVYETVFQTWPATNGGMNYQAQFTFGLDAVGPIIDIMNSLIPVPPALALGFVGAPNPENLETIVGLNLVYAGTQKKGRKFTNLFKNLSTSLDESMISYADLPTKGAGGLTLAKCINGQRQDMYGISTKRLDRASFVTMFAEFGDLIKANPALNASAFLVETFGQQGVRAVPNDYNAFPHRRHIENLVEINMAYEDDSVAEVADAWAGKWRDHFKNPNISGYDRWFTYQNYGHGDEPPSVVYGRAKWRHQRLTALKNTYDPHGVFNAFHAVPTSLADWN